MNTSAGNKRLFIAAYIFVSFICILSVRVSFGMDSFDSWITLAGTIVLLHSLLGEYILIFSGYRFFSPANLFLLCLYLFYWGQIMLLAFFKSYNFRASGGNFINRYPDPYYKYSCLFVLIFIALYVMGAIAGNNIKITNRYSSVSYGELDIAKAKKLAVAVMMITIPVNLYETFLYIAASFKGGYLATFRTGISHALQVVSSMAVMGFVLLMYALPSKSKKIFIASCVFFLPSMFSGNRSPAICAVLTSWCFYMHIVNKKKKMKLRYFVLIIVLGYFGLSALSTIGHFRDHSYKTLTMFLQMYVQDLKNNALLRAVEEFGGTMADVSIIQMYLNDTGNFFGGWTFISGLFAVFLNFGNVIAPIVASGSFGGIVQEHGIYGGFSNIGGSCIAESIINFGYFFGIEAFIIGCVLGELSFLINNDRFDKRMPYYIMIVYVSLFWVRGYFTDMVRGVVWSWILLYVLGLFGYRYKEKRNWSLSAK